MSSEMSFKGSYTYADADAVETAISAASVMLDGEDMPSPFESDEISRKGLTLTIEIDTSCPSDWYFTYEGIVETLAEHAKSGNVKATIDDESETIPAGPPDDEDDDE
jgi:hypothetical protein